ncbi:MAG: type I-E CRISPR-associated protein Cas6/Cse3/CasE [Hydrogenophaga sp.]|uniref:type I-E CRISPR-associated protein Cas6/Cse3/CasE n=1 Tax=Hydrogenophaga sp. TaxID=1904254 RepID=UPI003D0DAE4B
MFLTRVELPWEAARNPYDIHRQLWRLFPGEAPEPRVSGDEKKQGFLFRVESNLAGRPARLLVQSRLKPEIAPGVSLIGTREFHPNPSAGQRLAFLLTANPVKTIVDVEVEAKPDKLRRHVERSDRHGDKTSCLPKSRVPLVKEEEQRQWLSRKLTGAGMVEGVSVLPHAPTYFRKGNMGGKLVTATFEGVLNVINAECLTDLLTNGIGPAKAFGCGLLLVRRC